MQEQIRKVETLKITDSVLKNIKVFYGKLVSKGIDFKIDQSSLRDLPEGFLSILAKEKPFDKEGVTALVYYAAPRLPEEIFATDHDVVIRFNSNPDFFIDEKGTKEGVVTAQNRCRWYKIETIDDLKTSTKKKLITFHSQSQTAIVETMIHLSVIEQLRSRARELVKNTKLSKEEIDFLWDTLGLLIKKNSAPNKIQDWANRKLEIEGSPNMTPWNELISGEKSSQTSLKLAEIAETFLLKEGKNSPSVLFFSNTYSLENILSHYLLNKKTGNETVRDHIVKIAEIAWGKNKGKKKDKTSLEAIGESIQGIKRDGLSQDQINFIVDNIIIFDLTKNGETGFGDEITDLFVKEFKDPQKKMDLGIATVVERNHSPTADPLLYIDFSKIKDEVIEGSNPILRGAIDKLRKEKLAAFFLPYAPGDLTYSIITEMKKKVKSIKAVAEVGKVAHLITGKKQRKIREIGQLVLPKQMFSSYGETELSDFPNKVKPEHIKKFENIREVGKTILMQALSVVLQDEEIMSLVKELFSDNLPKQNITLNMEVGPIKKAVIRLGLLLFEVDYISDHAIPNGVIEDGLSSGRKNFFQQITKSLARKGRYGVHAATASVILEIADSYKI